MVSVARAAPSTTLLEVEDICFATGREILFPGGWSRADAITGLGVVAAALTYARRHPECRLLVAGHAASALYTSLRRRAVDSESAAAVAGPSLGKCTG